MSDGPAPDIDDVLALVERLLAEEDSEDEARAAAGMPPGRARDGLPELGDLTQDGFAEIDLSADRMEARASVYPPVGRGRPVDQEEFLKLLRDQGVRSGIDFPAVEAALGEAARGGRPQEGFPAARGLAPVPALPARWQLAPGLEERWARPDPLRPFTEVCSGDLLAVLEPPREPQPGLDVTGNPVPVPAQAPVPGTPVPGPGVVAGTDRCSAGTDGHFRLTVGQFSVVPVLTDSGDRGPVDFDGDVVVTGTRPEGARIQARGSVFAPVVLTVADIQAEGDLAAPLGLLGREGALVTVGGGLSAPFVENLVVRSRGPMEISGSLVNSTVQTLDRLVMGPKGWVIGGKVFALNGADVFQVGSDRGPHAEIHCGMDYTVLDQVAWARDQSLSLVSQLKTIEAYMSVHPERQAALAQAGQKIRAQVTKLSEQSRNWALSIDRNELASITVRGLVYPGTYLEICHVSFLVAKPLGRVRFYLDRTHGKIAAVPL